MSEPVTVVEFCERLAKRNAEHPGEAPIPLPCFQAVPCLKCEPGLRPLTCVCSGKGYLAVDVDALNVWPTPKETV